MEDGSECGTGVSRRVNLGRFRRFLKINLESVN